MAQVYSNCRTPRQGSKVDRHPSIFPSGTGSRHSSLKFSGTGVIKFLGSHQNGDPVPIFPCKMGARGPVMPKVVPPKSGPPDHFWQPKLVPPDHFWLPKLVPGDHFWQPKVVPPCQKWSHPRPILAAKSGPPRPILAAKSGPPRPFLAAKSGPLRHILDASLPNNSASVTSLRF